MRSLLVFLSLFSICATSLAKSSHDPADWREWSIVVSTNAIPSERYASQEFQRLFREVTGLELGIRATPPHTSNNIFVGHSPTMARSSAGFTVDDLSDEGVRIRIVADNVGIAGGRPRGTLYAVYEFMERYLGVRFLTADHTYVPKQSRWRIPCERWSFIPPFAFRWSYYHENAENPEFAARLRNNTVTHDEKLGGVTPQSLINHTLHRLLPVEEYGKEHPEYFALVDGERKLKVGGGGPEPCVTHPDVIEIVARNVIKELDQNPNRRNFSVSQNDNDAYCRCDRCEAINRREGTPMGSHLAFVNAVAERVEEKHPQVKIGTLAYWYTRKPPRTIRPRSNVQIQLCSIECSTLYALDDPSCAKNRSFCDDLNEWGRICEDIWIWNYNTNFRYYDLPFPNLRVISPNLQYFLRNNVHGVFMQANGNGKTGELCDLRNYVISRCLWDPERDSWDVAMEFCRLHYGKAARTMMRYMKYLHDNAEDSGLEPTCFPMPFEVGLHPESADRIFGFFRKAMSQVEDETIRLRVEKASICAYRAVLEVGGHLEIREGRARLAFPERYGDVVGDYLALTRKHGQTRAEEWQPIDHYYRILERTTQEGYRAEQLENEIWRLIVLAEDEAKVVGLLHKPSQRHLLMPPGYRSLRHLFEHLTLRESAIKGIPGSTAVSWNLQAVSDGLRLTAELNDDSMLERHIGFVEERPEMIRFHTHITHDGDKPQTYQARIHPEFYTGQNTDDHKVISGYVRDGAWFCFNEGWGQDATAGRARLAAASGGGYAFFNHVDRFGARLDYDPEKIDRPTFHWSDRYPMVTLQFDTKPVELAAGESASFQYDLRFLSQPPKPLKAME